MQADQESISFLATAGISFGSVTSATAKIPPALSTRKDSLKTPSLSGERLITQFEMM